MAADRSCSCHVLLCDVSNSYADFSKHLGNFQVVAGVLCIIGISLGRGKLQRLERILVTTASEHTIKREIFKGDTMPELKQEHYEEAEVIEDERTGELV